MNMRRILFWLGVALLQLIMTQAMTFLFSLLVPGMEGYPQARPALFVVILGATYTMGVFLAGWLALRRRWRTAESMYSSRLIATSLGAYVPLAVALILYRTLGPGNPFFLVSALTAILGFHLPGWIRRK